jgi:uncharacterized repeat protein (TIGR04052 family)
MRHACTSLVLAAAVSLAAPACDDADDEVTLIDAGTNDAGRGDAGLDAARPDALVPTPPDADASGLLPITLRFKGKVGSADLVCGQQYPGQGSANTTITPHDFRFFVHDVRLITAAGVSVPVTLDARLPYQTKDLALIDFGDGAGRCDPSDQGTNMLLTGLAPPGNYSSVAFTVGVPESLNHENPAAFPGPLQAPGVSWDWTFGFRFVMAEVFAVTAQADLDGGAHGAGGHDAGHTPATHDGGAADGGHAGHGAPMAGLGFVHLGSTGCVPGNPVTCAKANRPEIKLDNFSPRESTIVADLGAVFSTADLSTNVQCHGDGASCAPMVEALGVNLQTGAPLATQRVFRVE